jgi:FeS assembly SUF system protein
MKRPEDELRGAADAPGGNGARAPEPDPTVHPADAAAFGRPAGSFHAASAPEEERQSAGGGSHPAPPAADRPAPAAAADPERLREAVIDVLRTVYDPEIPVNIYEIGLVYQLDVSPRGEVKVQMTLTSPMCPVAESLPPEVEAKIAAVHGVTDVQLDLVWDPPWNPTMMSEEARLLLNIG